MVSIIILQIKTKGSRASRYSILLLLLLNMKCAPRNLWPEQTVARRMTLTIRWLGVLQLHLFWRYTTRRVTTYTVIVGTSLAFTSMRHNNAYNLCSHRPSESPQRHRGGVLDHFGVVRVQGGLTQEFRIAESGGGGASKDVNAANPRLPTIRFGRQCDACVRFRRGYTLRFRN